MLVRQNLDLNVSRALETSLKVHRGLAEGRLGFRARRAKRGRQLRRVAGHAHALASPAGDSLDHHRVTNARCRPRHLSIRDIRSQRLVAAGNDRNAGCTGTRPRRSLAAELCDSPRTRADEGQALIEARLGELGALCQKPVPRMHRIRAS